MSVLVLLSRQVLSRTSCTVIVMFLSERSNECINEESRTSTLAGIGYRRAMLVNLPETKEWVALLFKGSLDGDYFILIKDVTHLASSLCHTPHCIQKILLSLITQKLGSACSRFEFTYKSLPLPTLAAVEYDFGSYLTCLNALILSSYYINLFFTTCQSAVRIHCGNNASHDYRTLNALYRTNKWSNDLTLKIVRTISIYYYIYTLLFSTGAFHVIDVNSSAF